MRLPHCFCSAQMTQVFDSWRSLTKCRQFFEQLANPGNPCSSMFTGPQSGRLVCGDSEWAGELWAWQLLPGESLLPQEVARRGLI